MYYDEEFVQSLPEDHPSAFLRIADYFYEIWEGQGYNSPPPFDLISETHAFLSVYLAREKMTAVYAGPQGAVLLEPFTGSEAEDQRYFLGFIHALQEEMRAQVNKSDYTKARQQYALMLGTGFYYEFSEGDLARIQALVNELRNLIAASDELEERHKRRVLGRLEKLQSELHKKVSDLSWIWGELIEASITAKIIGENAKPIVDRIREIAKIVWPAQARAFDLPSNTPFKLPGQTEDEKS